MGVRISKGLLCMAVAAAMGYAHGAQAQGLADIDGNGAVDAIDVQLVVNAALGVPVPFDCDVDGSGAVDAIDIQRTVNAVLGILPGPLSLAGKAAVFQYDLLERFDNAGQINCKLRVPTPERPYISYNMPDNAYMTGIYLGSQAMRWHVTGHPAAKAAGSAAIEGLDLLCNVSGHDGLLARAAVRADSVWYDDGDWQPSGDGTYLWRADVSSDQVDGVLFGFALAYDLLATPAEQAVIAQNAAALVDHILDNDLRIVDYDGEPTTWGKYYPEYVQNFENMNALLMLQHLKVAHHVTGEARFDDAYWHLINTENYADIAITARVMRDPLLGQVNHSDDVLLFLAYYPLLMYETDPEVRGKYLASLQRYWNGANGYPGVAPEANPLYAFLVNRFLGETSGTAAAVVTLERFPLDMKWNSTALAAYEQRFGFTFDPTPISPLPTEPGVVPIDRRPKTWSAWVQNPYVAGERNHEGGQEYNGHDYLIGYWLGRYEGYIGASQ